MATPADFEALINERLADYPLTPDNRHRLAAWSELKGDYLQESNSLVMHFGDMGKLEVYPDNFLLRTASNHVYHLDRRRTNPRDVAVMNETLRVMFEQISLLANHDAHPDLIYFVDEHLARKNLEPFEKLYLRHILIRFGKYNAALRQVEFRTDWLPVKSYQYEAPGREGTHFVNKPIDPLIIKLDEATVRGYYLSSGGTVYVEDVTRDVFYATGESYTPNVSAFKLFLQQLFTQTTTFVVKEEEARIQHYHTISHEKADDAPVAIATRSFQVPTASTDLALRGQEDGMSGIKPLYTPQDWMGKMLGTLRYHNSLMDREVAGFLIHQPFFLQLYKHFSPEEKAYYDRMKRK